MTFNGNNQHQAICLTPPRARAALSVTGAWTPRLPWQGPRTRHLRYPHSSPRRPSLTCCPTTSSRGTFHAVQQRAFATPVPLWRLHASPFAPEQREICHLLGHHARQLWRLHLSPRCPRRPLNHARYPTTRQTSHPSRVVPKGGAVARGDVWGRLRRHRPTASEREARCGGLGHSALF